MQSPAPAHTNRLAREKSPYLLQHATNPVDWFPWGEEAFARARAENKPIFLSIGYSTCHWCHVMERESFVNDEVALLLNTLFVPVKVDREERPDVDRLYMTAMQALGQGGGWPLNVFLTPELEPFWGGTYFPPSTTSGRPGLIQLLPRLAEAWRDQREQVEGTGEQVMAMLRSLGASSSEARDVRDLAQACAASLAEQHDEVCGGFGMAPKFPSPGNLHFLLRRWARGAEDAQSARRMALGQLEAMRANGIHDHLGGGFHRYATDREWRIPHFEKMLYDQALLASAYLDAYQTDGDARWADTARDVFEYVQRDLTSPEGAFYSAEDADSEGEEGRFYAWTPAELSRLLGDEAAARVGRHFGVTARGNFEHDTTVLHEARPGDPIPHEARNELAAARATLLAARSRRVRPHLDDKVITAWNALMIAALAQGARVLDAPDLAERAARAADFIWTHLRRDDGALLRRYRDGEAACAGQLDDHAYYAHACLELFAATHEPRWLERAALTTEVMVREFWDNAEGGLFESPQDAGGVAIRLKDSFDGAELAGNSIAAELLWRLAALLDRSEWREYAQRSITYHARRLAAAPWAMPRMVAAMERSLAAPRHVVIVGPRERADTRDLVAVFAARLRADDDLVVVDESTRATLSRWVPFAAALPMRDGRATAYVCVDYACRQPVHTPQELAAVLDGTN
jgi:uncharacterized protein YyaL (SSP411 family)